MLGAPTRTHSRACFEARSLCGVISSPRSVKLPSECASPISISSDDPTSASGAVRVLVHRWASSLTLYWALRRRAPVG